MRVPAAALPLLLVAAAACGSGDDGRTPTEPTTGQLVVQARSVTDIAPSPFAAARANVLPPAFDELGDPSRYVVGVYQFSLARTADCSDPVLLASNATARALDLLTNPVLFTVTGEPGRYECIVLRISDVFSFEPATTFGNCVAGTTYTVDTYRDGESGWRDVDGAPITGSGSDDAPIDNRVDVFFSTDPSAVQARGYSPNQIVPLVSGPVIPGSTTFVYDVRGQVVDRNGACRSAGGTYTFR